MAFQPGSVAEKYKTTATSSGFKPGSISSKYQTASSKTLDTSQGLYNLATSQGLKEDADRILKSQSGEKTKEIFSGGFISDAFDTLSAFQYGVVGMLKGKTFLEGVKTRQSFTDQDALGDKGLPGMLGGIVLDIAFDPLTYIAPATVVKKVPLLAKALKGVKELAFGKKVTRAIEGTEKTFETLEGGTKTGKYLASKVGWMFGADPVFRETYEKGIKNIAIETGNVVDISKGVSELPQETAGKLLHRGSDNRLARVPLNELKGLSSAEFEIVSKVYNKIDSLGQQAVDLGLLSREKFEENVGEYLKNAYSEYELAKGKGLFGSAKLGIKGIKKRVEGLTPERMKELGQIDNPAYLLFKSALDLSRDVENAKIFKTVAEKFGTNVAQEGFTQIPKGVRAGALAGKYVPEHMATYLNEIIEPAKDNIGKQLVANFKFFKVIMNPATHARNIVSNKILNWWKLGMNPLDPRVIASDVEAAREIVKGGGKWAKEATPFGYNLDTFASAEMKGLLDDPATLTWGNKLGSTWQKTKKKLGDFYQKEENQAKLSAYIFNRKKGFSPEESWKAAESATFNYAQVTPFVRKLRESLFGFPFITFTVKSTPIALETAVKHPVRISSLGKIKQAIEQQADIKETERERASEPPWVRNGFYVKLPIKDKEGRSAYFDMTYILPFGDIVSGNFLERGTSRETGLPESRVTSLAKKSPFISLISELSKNQDFYGNKIWRDSDPTEKQMGDIMRHLSKTYLPPVVADNLPGGYNAKGERQQRGLVGAIQRQERPDEQRTVVQEILRNVGAKIQPIDVDIQETYQEWNKKKALENFLVERGVLNQFRKIYQPKK